MEQDKYFQKFMSHSVGIISKINLTTHSNLFADNVYLYSAQTGDLSLLFPNQKFSKVSDGAVIEYGSACDVNKKMALRKAVFETIERYAASIVSSKNIHYNTYDNLKKDAIDILTLPKLVKVNSNTITEEFNKETNKPIRWIQAFNLSTDRAVYVPFPLVHINNQLTEFENFHIPSSTGLAAHTSLEEAILSGLYEVIERDAVECIWRFQPKLPELNFQGINDTEIADLDFLDSSEFISQKYFDATFNIGIPTVYTVRKISLPIGNDVILSCASGKTLFDAAKKTRKECSGRQSMYLNETKGLPYTRFKNADGVHLNNCLSEEPDFSFLENNNIRTHNANSSDIKFSEINGELQTVVKMIKSQGHEVIVVNLTTTDLRNNGVYVVKVIIPTLTQPTNREGYIYMPEKKYYKYDNYNYLSSGRYDEQPFE